MFFQLLLLLSVASYLIYKWATYTHDFFAKRGVPYEKPWPLLGNNLDIVLKKESLFSSVLRTYQKSKAHKIFGVFNFRAPIFVVNDPELIKKIAIKDFDHFPNHSLLFPTSNDKMLDNMLSILKDQRWKSMRNTLSPIFTAAKMRAMFSLMNECFEECLSYLNKLPKNAANGVELELKQCFTCLSNDLIASTAFGLKINSYENIDNEFYRIGQTLIAFRGTQMLKITLASVAPKLMSLLGIRLLEAEKTDYFMRLVVDAMKYREEHKIVRPDMIQLLMEAKKRQRKIGPTSSWWLNALSSSLLHTKTMPTSFARLVMSFCEILMYSNVSTRKQSTCTPNLRVSKLKYMDMVVSESLRYWSLAPFTDRQCSKDYTLRDEDDNVVFEFKVGDKIWFPIFGLHRDEKYFKNSDVFDPERFSAENKHVINTSAYIPFGVGPRICIGNRYALMQAKAMLYYLVLKFKLEASPKTSHNLLKDIRGFQKNPERGFWAKLIPRK